MIPDDNKARCSGFCRKLPVAAVIFFLAMLPASGGNRGTARDFPRFTFGIEGNCTVTFGTYYHYNFISADGYRINARGYDGSAACNGQLLANAGCNLNRNLNLSVYFGFGGIRRKETALPLSLRLTAYFGKDPTAGRCFAFADGGAAIGTDRKTKLSPAGKLGAGYRVSLTRSTKLDFLIACQMIYSHPDVSESIDGMASDVPPERIRRNNILINGITFGIGLNF